VPEIAEHLASGDGPRFLVLGPLEAWDRSRPEEAAEGFRAALALWRGPALAGVESGWLRRGGAARLDDLRLSVLEERLEADLALGRHAE
jgi:Bacterial transcriptional activator domain